MEYPDKAGKRSRFFAYMLFAMAFCMLCLFLNRYCDHLIDADAASELVMGKQLAEEGRLLSDNFYYSTELRVFESNLLWMPLFRLISNWHLVRMIGSILFYILMVACLYAFCRIAGLREQFPFLATLWLLPFSWYYFFNVLNCVFYAPTHATLLAAFALLFACLSSSRTSRTAAMTGGVLLAFLSGLNGLRMVLTLYMPLTLALLLALGLNPSRRAELRRLFLISCLLLVATLAGDLINSSFLATRYTFSSYNQIWFVPLDLQRLETAINAWLSCLGYRDGAVFSTTLAFCAEAGVLALLSLYSVIVIIRRHEVFSLPQQVMSYFFLFSLLLMFLLFSLTNMQYNNRYLLTAAALTFFPVFICFSNREVFTRKSGNRILHGLILLCLAVSLLQYREAARNDRTAAKREAAAFLTAAGYRQGYATFWNANVLTELSDGELELWVWSDPKVADPQEVLPWLQNKSHSLEHPEGKVFMLLSRDESEKNREWLKGFPDENVVFRSSYEDPDTGQLLIWGFDSYSAFSDAFS